MNSFLFFLNLISICFLVDAQRANNTDPQNFAGKFSKPTKCSIALAENAAAMLEATEEYVEDNQLTAEEIAARLATDPPALTEMGRDCFSTPNACEELTSCTETRYRSIDGYCNNLDHPFWGMAHTPFKRYLAPKYEDGFNTPRETSVATGDELPSARIVTTRIHGTSMTIIDDVSQFTMQWGQFLDHDITLTPIVEDASHSFDTCCDEDAFSFDECYPIDVPAGDKFYSEFEVTCLDFRRSQPAYASDCKLGFREQMNQITAFIDGSNVYGSSKADEKELKEFKDGLLKSQPNPVDSTLKEFLPDDDDGSCTNADGDAAPCFNAGDIRASEQPYLTAMHTVWMREHNRIAKELKIMNPGWRDTRIYEETRKIVGAMIQHITYNEFLPTVLGDEVMEAYKLTPQLADDGFFYGYDNETDPSIANVFAAAAYRFGHSLVHNTLSRMRNVDGEIEDDELNFSDAFFKPYTFNQSYPGGVDPLIKGLSLRRVWRVDFRITTELRDHLFQGHGHSFGTDLAAKNIQRGRDHGLPGYNDWREWCGLPRRTFQDIIDVVPDGRGVKFQDVYDDPDDIDLFSIGISEPPIDGGIVGETLACILGHQFIELKYGDRFWYENGGMKHSFTADQLAEVRKITLARVLCDNTDDLTLIQPQAFLTVTVAGNGQKPCSERTSMDLSKWKK